MTRLFALATRGLEPLVAQEMAPLVDRIVTVAYRRVEVEQTADLRPLASLRTADDLFVAVETWSDIGHTRAELERFRLRAAQLDLAPALDVCRTLRPISDPPRFSVTANFVGKRNYSVPELKSIVGEAVATARGWHYLADDAASDLNLRLFIEHTRAQIGIRLSAMPLHRRAYKVAQIPGSLKPTVAATMVRLALAGDRQPAVGMGAATALAYSHRARLLDPCCGAGTLVIEAAQLGLAVRGGDNDPTAVEAAHANWRAHAQQMQQTPGAIPTSGVIPMEEWDAQALPLPAQSVDYVVSNLPWGRQTTVDSRLETFYDHVCGEIQRVLAPGGRVVLLTSLPHLLRLPTLEQTNSLEISLFGQTPQIVCYTANAKAT